MVLLRNDGLLPLSPNQSVALIGPGVASTAVLGGGSAMLAPYRQTSVLEAAKARWGGEVIYAEGANLNRAATTVPTEWIGPGGVQAELFDADGFEGAPQLTKRRWAAFNVWHDRNWPESFEQLAVRLRFTVTPEVAGPYRVTGSGFGRTRLMIDGEVVLDSAVNGFRGPNATQVGEATLELAAGRTYAFVLEQHPEAGGPQVAITDVGLERQTERDTELRQRPNAPLPWPTWQWSLSAPMSRRSPKVGTVRVWSFRRAKTSSCDEFGRRTHGPSWSSTAVPRCFCHGSKKFRPRFSRGIPARRRATPLSMSCSATRTQEAGCPPPGPGKNETRRLSFTTQARLTLCATARSCTLATAGTTPEVWPRWSRSVMEVPTQHSNGACRRWAVMGWT